MYYLLTDILANIYQQTIIAIQDTLDQELNEMPPHRIVEHTVLTLVSSYILYQIFNRAHRANSFINHHGGDGIKRLLLNTALEAPVAGNYLKKTIDEDILLAKVDFIASTLKAHLEYTGSGKLDKNPLTIDEVKREQQSIVDTINKDILAKASGQFYGSNSKEVEEYLSETSAVMSRLNPLHADTNKLMPLMYSEVIEIARDLFHGPQGGTYGVITHGGTYSIVEAVIAYSRRARKFIPQGDFNIVVPETAHWAFEKAGQIVGVEVRKCSIDMSSKKADVNSMRSLIDKNTILLVGSAPNYPYGIADDIDEIAKLGLDNNIGVHVDACLGGFYTCFESYDEENILPHYDFRIEGVTSLSADTHKYGQAPKGSSLLLTNDQSLANYLSYAFAGNAGGIYATLGMGGSSSLARIQEILTTMKSKGRAEYERITKGIAKIRTDILSEITNQQQRQNSIFNKITVIGEPKLNVIAFTADDSCFFQEPVNILQVLEYMNERKKWDLNVLQNPHGFHLCLTAVHVDSSINTCKVFMSDLSEALDFAIKNPITLAETKGSCGVYGTKAKIGMLSDPILEEAAISYTHAKYNYWPDAKTLEELHAIRIKVEDATKDVAEKLVNYEIKKIAARVVAEQHNTDINILLKKIKQPDVASMEKVAALRK